MKALRFQATGSLDELEFVDCPDPQPADGEVLVRIEAAGLNTSDVSNVRGGHPYTTLPRIPGRDFSGIVVEGPPRLIGQAVWGTGRQFGFTRDGSHARLIAAPADGIAPKPASLSHAQAAACGVPFVTAWAGLEKSGVGKDCRLLVVGAAGGVGSAAVTLARWLGADVTGAVRKPGQLAAIEASGARSLLLPEGSSLEEATRAQLGQGYDVVFEIGRAHV